MEILDDKNLERKSQANKVLDKEVPEIERNFRKELGKHRTVGLVTAESGTAKLIWTNSNMWF